MNCPICDQPNGFHGGRCYEYSPTPELVGPKESKAFMEFLRERILAESNPED